MARDDVAHETTTRGLTLLCGCTVWYLGLNVQTLETCSWCNALRAVNIESALHQRQLQEPCH